MRKIVEKIVGFAAAIFTTVCAFAICLPIQSGTVVTAASKSVTVKASEITYSEFAEFSIYEDTHRTRLIVQKGASEWGIAPINSTLPELLSYITVNGKTVAQHRNDYAMQVASGTAPTITSADSSIASDANTPTPIYAPINVLFMIDYQQSANVIDIYIPESYLAATAVEEIGLIGGFSYLYEGDDICLYTIEGNVSFKNPNAPAPLPVYTVNVNGAPQEVEEGKLATEPEILPTKEEDEKYVYKFDGWLNEDTGASFSFSDPITSNLTIVPNFRKIAKLTVTIDGMTQTVLEGSKLTKPNYEPTKDATESHTYAFQGWCYIENGEKRYWNFEADEVRGNLTLTADFLAVEKTLYTVTFDFDNGDSNVKIMVYAGARIKTEQIPEAPKKEETQNARYTFCYWSADGENAWDFEHDAVTGTLILKAYYSTQKFYAVSFDGKVQNCDEGSHVEKPADPEKENTVEYIYTFDGWYYYKEGSLIRWDFDVDRVFENVSLVSRFTSTKVRYTVYFYADSKSGEAITQTLEWGETIPYSLTFEKAGYEMLGWIDENGDAAVSVMPTKDLAVYANWQAIEYTATVTCANEEMYELTYTIETAKTALEDLKRFLLLKNSAEYAYTWTEELPQSLPLSDCTFEALETKVRYKLTIVSDFSGENVTQEGMLAWGESLVLESPENIRGKSFLGWVTSTGESAPATMPTANLTVWAVWEWIEYTAAVIGADGVEDEIVYTAQEADDPSYVQALFARYPLPKNTDAYTYAWNVVLPEVLPLESGKVYKIKRTPIEYAIAFVGVEGLEPLSFTVESLGNLSFPEIPAKLGYTCAWDKALEDIKLENTTVTAIYTPIEYTITFAGVEDVESIVFTVETLPEVSLPAVPEKTGYTGIWDKTLADVTLEDIVITAIYTEIPEEENPSDDPSTDSSQGPSETPSDSSENGTSSEEPVVEPGKDYGDRKTSGCGGLVGMNFVGLTALGGFLWLALRKKQD